MNSNAFHNSATVFDMNYYEKYNHLTPNGPPLLGLGCGDSALFFNIMPADSECIVFNKLYNEIQWENMNHRGGKVPRLISVQGNICSDYIPLYRHPVDEQPPLLPWTEFVNEIRHRIEVLLNCSLNHCLIQLYRSGFDFISEHADKTIDINKNSCIINFSAGASRVMILRSKPDIRKHDNEIIQKITLPNNSMFVLGWRTNLLFTHAIKQDKRCESLKSDDEKFCDSRRISLTFRDIATFQLRDDSSKIFGQGATRKTRGQLNDYIGNTNHKFIDDAKFIPSGANDNHVPSDLVIDPNAEVMNNNDDNSKNENLCSTTNNGIVEECNRLLQAFSNENKSSVFDWDKEYGSGFDVTDFRTVSL